MRERLRHFLRDHFSAPSVDGPEGALGWLLQRHRPAGWPPSFLLLRWTLLGMQPVFAVAWAAMAVVAAVLGPEAVLRPHLLPMSPAQILLAQALVLMGAEMLAPAAGASLRGALERNALLTELRLLPRAGAQFDRALAAEIRRMAEAFRIAGWFAVGALAFCSLAAAIGAIQAGASPLKEMMIWLPCIVIILALAVPGTEAGVRARFFCLLSVPAGRLAKGGMLTLLFVIGSFILWMGRLSLGGFLMAGGLGGDCGLLTFALILEGSAWMIRAVLLVSHWETKKREAIAELAGGEGE